MEEISYCSANPLNEFDSAMQSSDADRVLQSRKGKDHFINLAIVIGGIIAFGMGQHDIVMTFGKYVYQGMFVCGLTGFLIAGFTID